MFDIFKLSHEEIIALCTLTGTISGGIVFLWRVFKVCGVFLRDHDTLQKDIKEIKSQIITNDGTSIQTAIKDINLACRRVECGQRIIDQRSKAALHYFEKALFEISNSGNIIWFNEAFHDLSSKIDGDFLEGKDWISMVHEDHREDFVKEITSCLNMSRKIDITTINILKERMKFLGFPYFVNGQQNNCGFLISCFII